MYFQSLHSVYVTIENEENWTRDVNTEYSI